MRLRVWIGVAGGVIPGFGWHKPAGGSTGACPLTSRPSGSTLYRLVVGGLMATGFH